MLDMTNSSTEILILNPKEAVWIILYPYKVEESINPFSRNPVHSSKIKG